MSLTVPSFDSIIEVSQTREKCNDGDDVDVIELFTNKFVF